MPNDEEVQTAIQGKTYTLYGNSTSSDKYFELISDLSEKFIREKTNEQELLALVQNASRKKRFLKRLLRYNINSDLSGILRTLTENLSPFTTQLQNHLSSLPVFKRWKSIFTLSKEQYHLFMLEIELTNRINRDNFLHSEYKFAFLPHCIRDFSQDCLSAPDEVDYVCKACSKICSVNKMSKLLRKNKVKPYLWMSADLRKLFRRLKHERKNIGVLGVACIPELIRGMRLCMRANVPVVGVQLDANRCQRWMGDFYENTINMQKLKSLITIPE